MDNYCPNGEYISAMYESFTPTIATRAPRRKRKQVSFQLTLEMIRRIAEAESQEILKRTA